MGRSAGHFQHADKGGRTMTIDLKLGVDRPPNRLDYCTKVAGVSPAPEGTPCPMWMAFLERATEGNADLVAFLKRFLGYCMTGYMREHVLVFLFGTGANGKSVF